MVCTLRLGIAVACLCSCAVALAQVGLSNTTPVPFETVRVRIARGVVGNFPQRSQYPVLDEAATRISMAGGKITVTLRMLGNFDFNEIPPSEPVDLAIGQFPPGSYDVEVLRELPDGTPAGSIGTASFTIGAPPAWLAPAINYSGIWWNPDESGWGLNLIQHGSGVIFATWFVYGADGKPVWYVVPDGTWSSVRDYIGPVYRTTGPVPGSSFDPSKVSVTRVGTAHLYFNWNGTGLANAGVEMNLDSGRVFKLITPQAF